MAVCEVCGSLPAKYVCQRCGSRVCRLDYDPASGLCSRCLSSTGLSRQAIPAGVKLMLLGFLLMFTGFILMFMGALEAGATGGAVVIFPIPLVFYSGEGGAILALIALVIAFIMVVFTLVWWRSLEGVKL